MSNRGCYAALVYPFAVVLLLGLVAPVLAAEEYRLAPEDVLDVTVLGEPELSTTPQQGIVIGPDGRISYPLLGSVDVTGKTVGEVETLIKQAVSQRVRDPVVSVRVRQFRMNRIYVLGMVGGPGVYDLKAGWGVKAAIAAAGGLGSGRGKADLKGALLIRDNKEVLPLDLEKIVEQGDPSADLALKPGDTIVVRESLDRVAVLGAVGAPGYFELQPGDRVTDALARAGGPLSSPGKLTNVLVERRSGEVKTVNVVALMAGSPEEVNLTLQPGDTVIVPEARREVAILGYVGSPGYYTFREGARLTDAIALAGGAITEGRPQVADLSKVMLQRRGENPQMVDVSRLLAGGEGENPLLTPGDTIVVSGIQPQVAVLGCVNNPGYYTFGQRATLTDALALAGGAITDVSATGRQVADLRNVMVQRRGENSRTVDVSRLLAGEEGENPLIMPGDTIIVPGLQRQVAVLGYVNRSGFYVFGEGARLTDALALAGGEIRDEGDLENVRVQRQDGETRTVNLLRVLAGDAGEDNLLLKPGDTIVVAEARNQVLVLGQVKTPGYYRLREGDRLMDLIAKAGGTLKEAVASETYVVREENGQKVAMKVDVGGILAGKNIPDNILLAANDLVVVPQRKGLKVDDMLKALVGFYYVREIVR